jgi:hypothetical protein
MQQPTRHVSFSELVPLLGSANGEINSEQTLAVL